MTRDGRYQNPLGSSLFADLKRAVRDLGVDTGAAAEPPRAGASPVDDQTKAIRYMEIQERHMQAMMRTPSARPIDSARRESTDEVVAELQEIHRAYEELLQLGPPTFPLYSLDDVHARLADVFHRIAQTYEFPPARPELALEYYRRSIDSYRAAGRADEVVQLEDAITQLEQAATPDFDAELQRLETLRSTLDRPSLPHAETLVRLGELAMRGGDDYSARERLESALDELNELGHPDPGEVDMRAVLLRSMTELQAGRVEAGSTEVETLVTVHGLYIRSYQCLMQIWQAVDDADDPDRAVEKAREYSERLERLNRIGLTADDLRAAIVPVDARGATSMSDIRRIR
jgi:tetratricopeptide (TPR) repeat protein